MKHETLAIRATARAKSLAIREAERRITEAGGNPGVIVASPGKLAFSDLSKGLSDAEAHEFRENKILELLKAWGEKITSLPAKGEEIVLSDGSALYNKFGFTSGRAKSKGLA